MASTDFSDLRDRGTLNLIDRNPRIVAPCNNFIPDEWKTGLWNHEQYQSRNTDREFANISHRLVFGQTGPEFILDYDPKPPFIINALHVGDGPFQSALQ